MENKTKKYGDYFNIPNEKFTPSKTSLDENHVTVLELKAFAKPPVIDFRKVLVGKNKTKPITFINPYEQDVQVQIEKLPTKSNFSICTTDFTIQAMQEKTLTITWAPEMAYGVRELVVLRVNDSIRLQFIILGHAIPSIPDVKKSRHPAFHSPLRVSSNTTTPSRKSVSQTSNKALTIPQSLKLSASCGRIRSVTNMDYYNCLTDARVNNVKKNNMIEQAKLRKSCRRKILVENNVNVNVEKIGKKIKTSNQVNVKNFNNDDESPIVSYDTLSVREMCLENPFVKDEKFDTDLSKGHQKVTCTKAMKEINLEKSDAVNAPQLEEFLEDNEKFFDNLDDVVGKTGNDDDEIRRQTFVKTSSQPEILHQIYDNFNNSGFDAITGLRNSIKDFGNSIDGETEKKLDTKRLNSDNRVLITSQNEALINRNNSSKGWPDVVNDTDVYDQDIEDESVLEVTVISNPIYSEKNTVGYSRNNNNYLKKNNKANDKYKDLKSTGNNSRFIKEKNVTSLQMKKINPVKNNKNNSESNSVRNIKLMSLQSVEALPRMRWNKSAFSPDPKFRARSNNSGGGKFIKDKTILNSCFTRKYPVSPLTKPCLERKNCIKYRSNVSMSTDDLSSYATCMASYGNYLNDSCGDKKYLSKNLKNSKFLNKNFTNENQYSEDTKLSMASSFKTCSENFLPAVAFPKETAEKPYYAPVKLESSFSDISSNTFYSTNLPNLRTGTYTKLDNDNIFCSNDTLRVNQFRGDDNVQDPKENDIYNIKIFSPDDKHEESKLKSWEDDFYSDCFEDELKKIDDNELDESKPCEFYNVSHITEGDDEYTNGDITYKSDDNVKNEAHCTEDMIISPLNLSEDIHEANYDIFLNCPMEVLEDYTNIPSNVHDSPNEQLPVVEAVEQKKMVKKTQKTSENSLSLIDDLRFRSNNPLVNSAIYKKTDITNSQLNVVDSKFSKCENVLKNTLLNLQSCIKQNNRLKVYNDKMVDYEKKVLDWKVSECSRIQNRLSGKGVNKLSFKKSTNLLIKKRRNVVLVNRSKWRSPLQHRNEQIPKCASCESNRVAKKFLKDNCSSSNNVSKQSVSRIFSPINHTISDKFKSFHTDGRSTIHHMLSNDRLSSQDSNKTLLNTAVQVPEDTQNDKKVKIKEIHVRSRSDDSKMFFKTLNKNFSSSKQINNSSSEINLSTCNVFGGSSVNLNYKSKRSERIETNGSYTSNLSSCSKDDVKEKSSKISLYKQQEEHRIVAFSKWMNFVFNPFGFNDADEGKKATRIKSSETDLSSLKRSLTRVVPLFNNEFFLLRKPFGKVWKRLRGLVAMVEKEVSSEKLSFRTDRPIFFHATLKEKLTNLLLSYNHYWLVLGLNTVFETNQAHNPNNLSTSTIVKSINDHFFNPPKILRAFFHDSDKTLYKEDFQTAINGHIIVKFLSLVLLLDRCKTQKVIFFDPCLFNKNSKYKSSMDILKNFSKMYLRKEDDIIKHLSSIKYHVTYLQTSLAETDYRVVDVQNDFKDGIRLSRLLQLLSQSWQLGSQMHAPFSYKNRLHNVTQIMEELTSRGISLEMEGSKAKICAEDIITGNLKATMELMWKICFHFEIKALLDEDILQAELKHLTYVLQNSPKKDNFCASANIIDFKDLSNNFCLVALMNWCRLVGCMYQLKIVDSSVSFWDGRALCYLLHHYYPSILPASLIQNNTLFANRNNIKFNEDGTIAENTDELDESDLSRRKVEEMIDNESRNYQVFNQKLTVLGGVPIILSYKPFEPPNQKVIILLLSFLSNRIFSSKGSLKATTCLQRWWKGVMLQKEVDKRIAKKKEPEPGAIELFKGSSLDSMSQKKQNEKVVDHDAVVKENDVKNIVGKKNDVKDIQSINIVEKGDGVKDIVEKNDVKGLVSKENDLNAIVEKENDVKDAVVEENDVEVKKNDFKVEDRTSPNGLTQINIDKAMEEKIEKYISEDFKIKLPESINNIDNVEITVVSDEPGDFKSVEQKVDEKVEIKLPELDFNEIDKHISTEMLSPRNNLITKYKKNISCDSVSNKEDKTTKKKVVGFDKVVHIVGVDGTSNIIKDSSITMTSTQDSGKDTSTSVIDDSVTKTVSYLSHDKSALEASTSHTDSYHSNTSNHQQQRQEFTNYVKMLLKSNLNSENFVLSHTESDSKMKGKVKGTMKEKNEENKVEVEKKIDSEIEMYDEKKVNQELNYLDMKENKDSTDYSSVTSSIPKISEYLEVLESDCNTTKNLKENYIKDSYTPNENNILVMHGDFTGGMKMMEASDERGEFEEELMMIEVLKNELKMREKELLKRLESSQPKAHKSEDKELKEVKSNKELSKESFPKRSILNPIQTENYIPMILKPTLKVKVFRDISLTNISTTHTDIQGTHNYIMSSTNTFEGIYATPGSPRKYPKALSSLDFTSEARTSSKPNVVFMGSSVLEVVDQNSKMSAFPSTTDSKVSSEKSENTIEDETENEKGLKQARSNVTESGLTSSNHRSFTEKTSNSKTADEDNTDKSENDDGELSKDGSDHQSSSDESKTSSNEYSNEKEKSHTKFLEDQESDGEKDESDLSEESDSDNKTDDDEENNLMIEKLGVLFLKHLKKKNKKTNSHKSYDSSDSAEDSKEELDKKIQKKLTKLVDMRMRKHNKAKNNSKVSKKVSTKKKLKNSEEDCFMNLVNKTVKDILEKDSAFHTGVEKLFFTNFESALLNDDFIAKNMPDNLIEAFVKRFQENYESMMVVKIQSVVRGWLTRRKFKETGEFTKSFTKAQLNEYRKKENDIGLMQDLAKSYLTKKIKKQKLISMFLLQAFIRASMLEKEQKPTNTAQSSNMSDQLGDVMTSKKQGSIFKIRDVNEISMNDVEAERLSENLPDAI